MKLAFKRIVDLRLERGLTQKEFAEAVGLPPVTISNYELGKREIRTANLIKIAEYFGVSVEHLLGKTDCRLPISTFEESFFEADGNHVTRGDFCDMLSKLSSEDRAAIHHMTKAMLKK